MKRFRWFAPLMLALWSLRLNAQEVKPAAPPDKPKTPDVSVFAGLGFRAIGPALTSGRVVAFAVHPETPTTYYVAAASGGVWKTLNAGTTWTPVFENEGSYSIGAITLDPKNPDIVWVGTGEHNGQRSVGYGDGIYKSEDGGKSWRNVGLKASAHTGRIVVDPRDSNVVYVAAQGPLWSAGGDRGLYKTTDGGKTWKRVLQISENTGVTDVILDPRDPNIVYAASWQRRRHVFTYVGGGPESGIHRSNDGGATWTRLRSGLPGGDIGRIGLAISPANPAYLYATIEAAGNGGGTYRSTDYGASWEKRGDMVAQGMYYGQIVADPKDPERVYLPNVLMMVSNDGGRTFQPLGEKSKHVDNHAIWINPANTSHYLVGCDGGVYESFDRGANWLFKSNLSIAQFYRVAVDNSQPFYYVYGGTQDNNSLGGPSRTKSSSGITNDDWFVTLGGDGFHQQVDPTDPSIVYSVLQYGVLSRLDRKTGHRVGIQPVEGKGEPALRWNWDSPLLISPHSHTRLYFAANRLFRSEDRGQSWQAISPDLTRQIDRNRLVVMGKVQKIDAVAKHSSTSFYGNIVSLAESPKKAGLLLVGTDDGLIQMTEDGGKNWRKLEKFPGVPEGTYVSRLVASQHDGNTLYAAFENHKNGDFAPYLLKSTDLGKTWTALVGDLPKNGPVLAFAEDPVAPNLLFVGTEFGLFFTVDGGTKWIRMRGGLPTIPVRDIAIQSRENDLVLATFGRGFYVLDDYTPLRQATPETLAKEAFLFPIKPVRTYLEYSRLGGGKGSQGETYFTAPNPPYGATFTYYLKESIKTAKQKRLEAEQEAERQGKVPPYPTADVLRTEAEEEPTSVFLMITDSEGQVVRRLTGPAGSGVFRVTWDLRTPSAMPILSAEGGGRAGFPCLPGAYKVSLVRRVNGVERVLVPPTPFTVEAEQSLTLTPAQSKALLEFRRKVTKLQRAAMGANEVLDSLSTRVGLIKRAIQETPNLKPTLYQEALALEKRTREANRLLRGDSTPGELGEPLPPSVINRLMEVSFGEFSSPFPPTQTRQDSYRIAADAFGVFLAQLRTLVKTDLPKLEAALDAAGAPHTPGRLPDWKEE